MIMKQAKIYSGSTRATNISLEKKLTDIEAYLFDETEVHKGLAKT